MYVYKCIIKNVIIFYNIFIICMQEKSRRKKYLVCHTLGVFWECLSILVMTLTIGVRTVHITLIQKALFTKKSSMSLVLKHKICYFHICFTIINNFFLYFWYFLPHRLDQSVHFDLIKQYILAPPTEHLDLTILASQLNQFCISTQSNLHLDLINDSPNLISWLEQHYISTLPLLHLGLTILQLNSIKEIVGAREMLAFSH